MSWWSFGEHSGFRGGELDGSHVTCAFCEEEGNWGLENRTTKKQPNSSKELFFDTLKCGNCANFKLVFWSGSGSLHDFIAIPQTRGIGKYPEHWPEDIGRYWLQAKRNLDDENWDAAALMAGSALQLALRLENADGNTLQKEVKDLATKGVLPPLMVEWADEVRWLRNPAAHPVPGQAATDPNDAKDVVEFLDFFLEYMLNLPHRINVYRARKQ